MEEDEYRIMQHIEDTYWWFRGKQFLLNILLKRYLANSTANMILDIGTGTGATLQLLQRYGNAYGIDASPVAIRLLARGGYDCICQSDVEDGIPFKSNTFSLITCLDVLEHVGNDCSLLEEMVRVCKPGGLVLITVPAMRLLWSKHDVALHHKRRYSKKQLVRQIGSLDVNVVKASYFNTSLFILITAVRGLKSFLVKGGQAKSDFYMHLPEWVNSALYYWYITELAYLITLDFPFGVSIVLVARKA